MASNPLSQHFRIFTHSCIACRGAQWAKMLGLEFGDENKGFKKILLSFTEKLKCKLANVTVDFCRVG